MTIGKSEDDYGDADDCFDVNESGGRDSDRCTLLRYFHPKMSGDLPKALYIHSDQAGRHAWLPHKGREERGHLAPYSLPASQPDPLLQPWHVLLKDGGGFELDPF